MNTNIMKKITYLLIIMLLFSCFGTMAQQKDTLEIKRNDKGPPTIPTIL